MKKPRTIYIVTSGNYSDYNVRAAYSTRKLAEQAVAVHLSRDNEARRAAGQPESDETADDHRIKELPIDSWPDLTAGAFVVWLNAQGKVIDADWSERATADEPPLSIRPDGFVGGEGWRFVGHGETIEHARRSAEELRRQTIVLQGNAAGTQ